VTLVEVFKKSTDMYDKAVADFGSNNVSIFLNFRNPPTFVRDQEQLPTESSLTQNYPTCSNRQEPFTQAHHHKHAQPGSHGISERRKRKTAVTKLDGRQVLLLASISIASTQ
jgi:hypothetical protein